MPKSTYRYEVRIIKMPVAANVPPQEIFTQVLSYNPSQAIGALLNPPTPPIHKGKWIAPFEVALKKEKKP